MKYSSEGFPFNLPFILDGATGTELNKRGMNQNQCTESFVLDHPDILSSLQTEYINSGSDAVLAPTFGANRISLKNHGITDSVDSVCKRLIDISMCNEAKKMVGGDISPTGLLLKPYGTADHQVVFDVYKEQAMSLIKYGVDFIFIETMISAAEAYLAVSAVRDVSKDIPVFVSMTVTESGKTINGDAMDAVLISLLPLSIQAFGCNCSIGPDVILKALRPASPIAKLYNVPLIAKPNAGMPITDENGVNFSLGPNDMSQYVDEFIKLGVGVFGGCCGTTPEHIKAISRSAKSSNIELYSGADEINDGIYVSTSRIWKEVDANAVYTEISGESDDLIYDLADELDPDEVAYFNLKEGAADLIIELENYLPNPISVCGDEREIEKLEKFLCRKIR